MDSPFPGMDPYLEPHWRSVHHRLITYAGDQLQAAAGPGAARVASPVVIELRDEPVTETYLEIVDTASGNKVLTAIELLSPTNKQPGDGSDLYARKQREYRAAGVSSVEIDLTRQGDRGLALPMMRIPLEHRALYLGCVRRSWRPRRLEAYPMPLEQPLPLIGVPLDPSCADAPLDLQAVVAQCYRNGRYGGQIDYRADPQPPLAPKEQAWTVERLREKGLRP